MMAMSQDRTILLVEDDRRIAALMIELLEDADYAVDGPYATLAEGIAAVAQHFPAGAVLDVRLKDGEVGMLADDLDLYGIPYLFCSGATDHSALRDHPGAPLIDKPTMARDLIPALDRLVH